MPPEPLPKSRVLVLAWAHEERLGRDESAPTVDFIWSALRSSFNVPESRDPTSYRLGFPSVLQDLQAYRLVQEDRDRYFRLHPRLDNRWGAYYTVDLGPARVMLFRSDLRLNTDGPTLPVLRMLPRLLDEAQPELVLSVGLGGGVRADERVGDVSIASAATFRLGGELDADERNGTTADSPWRADEAWFQGLAFPALREPALIPPSPNYPAQAGGWPQPAEHTPTVRIESRPLATAPALTRHMFRLASFDQGAQDYLGDEACAVDMDAAPVAHVCQGRVPFGFVTGVAVPALRDFRDDYQDALRYAWCDVFFEEFGERAAVNAAAVAERICTSF